MPLRTFIVSFNHYNIFLFCRLKASFLNDSPYSSQPASSQPSNQQHCKSRNKAALKKLILLSLRHLGIDKSHGEFGSIWKQLYCGCLFALVRSLHY